MSATSDNMVLPFEITILRIIQPKLLLLPVSGRHIGFHMPAIQTQCHSMLCNVGDSRKHGAIIWNSMNIWWIACVGFTSGLTSAIFDFFDSC